MTPDLSDRITAARAVLRDAADRLVDRIAAAFAEIETAAGPLVEPPPPKPARRMPRGHGLKPGYADDLGGTWAMFARYPGVFSFLLLELRWADLEPMPGVRQFGYLKSVLDIAEQYGVGVHLWVQTKAFGKLDRALCPAGIEPVTNAPGQLMAPIYRPEVGAQFCGTLRALRSLEGHPAFVGIETSESAPGKDVALIADYSNAAQIEAYKRIYDALAEFEQLQGYADVNSIAGKQADLLAYAATAGLGYSAGDAMPTAANDTADKIASLPSPRIVQVSKGAIDRQGVAGSLAFAKSLGADAYVWNTWGTGDASIDNVAQLIAA